MYFRKQVNRMQTKYTCVTNDSFVSQRNVHHNVSKLSQMFKQQTAKSRLEKSNALIRLRKQKSYFAFKMVFNVLEVSFQFSSITDSYASLFPTVWILPHTGLRQEKLHNFWTLLQRFPNSRFPFWPGLKNSASLLFLFSVCITINTLRVFLLLSKHVQFFHRGMYYLFIFGTNLDSGFGIRT